MKLREETLGRLRDALPNLLRAWAPSSTQPDYECSFCFRRPRTNLHEIIHDDDCLGIALQTELNE